MILFDPPFQAFSRYPRIDSEDSTSCFEPCFCDDRLIYYPMTASASAVVTLAITPAENLFLWVNRCFLPLKPSRWSSDWEWGMIDGAGNLFGGFSRTRLLLILCSRDGDIGKV